MSAEARRKHLATGGREPPDVGVGNQAPVRAVWCLNCQAVAPALRIFLEGANEQPISLPGSLSALLHFLFSPNLPSIATSQLGGEDPELRFKKS